MNQIYYQLKQRFAPWSILLLFILKTSIAYSQNERAVPNPDKPLTYRMEVFAGPGLFLPSFYYEPTNQKKAVRCGYLLGLGTGISVAKRFEINAKLIFQRGVFKNNASAPQDPNHTVSEEVKNNWLMAQLGAQYKFGNLNRFALGGGFYASSLQKSQTTTMIVDPNNINNLYATYNTYGLFKKYDFGLTASIGYGIVIKEKYSVVLQLLYTTGLKKINNYSVFTIMPIERNNSLSLVALLQLKNKIVRF